MPDHIKNFLTVWGEPDLVALFTEKAKGRLPVFADTRNPRTESEPFSFHALVPLPPEHIHTDYGRGVGMRMEVDAWGLKWGAYDHGKEPLVDPGLVTYRFTTPWEAPHKVFLPKVAAAWPELAFCLAWGGEGPCRGRGWFVRQARSVLDEPYSKAIWPEDDPNLDEDENYARSQAVTDLYLLRHAIHAAEAIAGHRGFAFDDVPILADWMMDQGWQQHADWLLGRNDNWWREP